VSNKVNSFAKEDQNNKVSSKISGIFTELDKLKEKENHIMSSLSSFESYEDPLIKFEAEEILETAVLPMSESILAGLGEVIKVKKDEKLKARENLSSSFNSLILNTIIIGVAMIVLGIGASLYTASTIVNPIEKIKAIIIKLGNGEQPEKIEIKSNDEIGEMSVAVNRLSSGLASTSTFAKDIGSGNLNADFTPLSNHDILGNSLLEMRKNLKSFSEDEKKRNWATEGLAKFSEILRTESNLKELSDKILSNLVKYVGANQGGLFLLAEDNDRKDIFFNQVSSYAYDRKKHTEKRLELGEGLIGQCYLEKETIYLTDVPDNYLSITSGLGLSNPRCILIVPLKVNEKIEGVLEIASFKEFEEYEIAFIEKIAENICSTISGVKTNEQTKKLLKDSQMLTEQLRSQEEEMRQNVEELMATQEEYQRKEMEYVKRIKELEVNI
jgi:putative methionine-R-sulfoxide reductase with GAF domain/HAMP domain-containing protein